MVFRFLESSMRSIRITVFVMLMFVGVALNPSAAHAKHEGDIVLGFAAVAGVTIGVPTAVNGYY
jgi:hypothetical protein